MRRTVIIVHDEAEPAGRSAGPTANGAGDGFGWLGVVIALVGASVIAVYWLVSTILTGVATIANAVETYSHVALRVGASLVAGVTAPLWFPFYLVFVGAYGQVKDPAMAHTVQGALGNSWVFGAGILYLILSRRDWANILFGVAWRTQVRRIVLAAFFGVYGSVLWLATTNFSLSQSFFEAMTKFIQALP